MRDLREQSRPEHSAADTRRTRKARRYIIVTFLLMLVAYPLSLGPVLYCVGRGWIRSDTVLFDTVYWPIQQVVNSVPVKLNPQAEATPWWEDPYASAVDGYWDLMKWFGRIGRRHRAQ